MEPVHPSLGVRSPHHWTAREAPGAVFLTSSCVMSVLQVCGPQFEQRQYEAPTQGLYLGRGGMEF